MPPSKLCPYCGPTEVESDDRLGHTVCLSCGSVIEENSIVAEVTFSETAKGSAIADGFQLSTGQARASHRGGFGLIRPGGQESREQTLQNGHRRIQDVANQPQIRMNERLVGVAQRFFNVAVLNNFTKGRKAGNVVAACLYIVCRLEKTAHMLIDFADALSTNVYQVGATFLALCKVAGVENLPLIDPSLYISRFASRLDFGDHTQVIIKDANRIVQRMNRDWIQIGRRPAGICASGLFIAARMHGFSRTIREIIMIVKICENTLRRRLKEFQDTASGGLSVSDFQTIWLEEEKDPPSFVPPSKSRKTEYARDAAAAAAAAASSSSSASTQDGSQKKQQQQDATTDNHTRGDGHLVEEGEEEEIDETVLTRETEQILQHEDTRRAVGDLSIDLGDISRDALLQLDDIKNGDNRDDDETGERLSDLDSDEEILAMVDVTPEEIEFKTMIWTEENKDWIVRQEAKRALELQDGHLAERRKPKKRQKSARRPEASSAAEAARNLIMSKPALSKKINYSVLDTLFEKPEPDE